MLSAVVVSFVLHSANCLPVPHVNLARHAMHPPAACLGIEVRREKSAEVPCSAWSKAPLWTLRGGFEDSASSPPPSPSDRGCCGNIQPQASPWPWEGSFPEDMDDAELVAVEPGEWWLRAFCCFFCGQWQMLKARRRARLRESEREEREQQAVHEIARLFGKIFSIEDTLDIKALLRGAQEGALFFLRGISLRLLAYPPLALLLCSKLQNHITSPHIFGHPCVHIRCLARPVRGDRGDQGKG